MINQKIKKLAQQAGFGLRDDELYTSKLEHLPITEDMEKFAELIVKECISIAEDRATFDWAPPNDVNHIISEIKEHFGVEE